MTETQLPFSHAKLLEDIKSFCERHGIGTSTFGIRALSNSGFYTRLAEGRSPSLVTVERVYKFMARYDKRKGSVDEILG